MGEESGARIPGSSALAGCGGVVPSDMIPRAIARGSRTDAGACREASKSLQESPLQATKKSATTKRSFLAPERFPWSVQPWFVCYGTLYRVPDAHLSDA